VNKREHFEREKLKVEKHIKDTRAKYTMEGIALRKAWGWCSRG